MQVHAWEAAALIHELPVQVDEPDLVVVAPAPAGLPPDSVASVMASEHLLREALAEQVPLVGLGL